MDIHEVAATVAARIDPAGWREEFDSLFARVAPAFARVEPRRRARLFVQALLGPIEVRTCWQIAEYAGESDPGGMQRLLASASWDDAFVRAQIRDYVVAGLGPGGVLIVDETGDAKKGIKTVGVQQQYTGTLGKVDNAQVSVHLAYATRAGGRALVDFRLYLPAGWTDDPQRCTAANVPDDIGFSTKPQLAWQMIEDALDAGVEAGWVTGDEVYGNDTKLRAHLRARQVGYVLAIRCDTALTRWDHPSLTITAAQLAASLPAEVWGRYLAGWGSKGPRYYQWTWVNIIETESDATHHGHHWLLLRRNETTGETAYYRCWSPTPVSLPTLTWTAGLRWPIESCFQDTKGQTGLDQHQVRTWLSWHRYTTLVLLAAAFLAVLAAQQPRPQPSAVPPADEIGPLSAAEIRRLLTFVFAKPDMTMRHALSWLAWRLVHQARARHYHHKRRTLVDISR
ncbi:IS701 family transposase [Hamadaea tsunoensis]|uniref:IS701 family transposase n=1 Tax=Hamadaea tsunoensis TaxID=53368 RepID=UPI001FE1D634|nr:IS701 family transposase [Hamadaea tsunoensis]